MRTRNLCAASVLVLFAATAAAQETPEGQDLAAAITGGKASINLRYRYEFVDQDSISKDANASTLRFRLNYQTGTWKNWSAFAEFDQVMEVLVDNYNSGAGTSSPGRSAYPVVADPDGSDLNQLYFQYAPNDDWRTRIGRQRILLDDQRFVGGVGWRQNEQTYDALSVNYGGFNRTQVFYSYVANVNRIFGDEVAAGNNEQDTHLLNVRYALSDAWNLTGYAYIIDNEDVPTFSTSTFGARIAGGFSSGDDKYDLRAEIATQSDNGNSPVSYDATYYRLQGTWSRNAWSAGVGLESLGSDSGQGFRTPLATLHAFNGWADQFLGTPGTGLEDLYFRVGYKPGKWTTQLIFHDFSADTGGGDYGSELDLSAGRKLGDRYNLLLKLAMFDADDVSYVDTTKFWMMLTAGF